MDNKSVQTTQLGTWSAPKDKEATDGKEELVAKKRPIFNIQLPDIGAIAGGLPNRVSKQALTTASSIVDGSVSTNALANRSVTTIKIAQNAVGSNEIDTGTGPDEVNASTFPLVDAGGFYNATTIEGALLELVTGIAMTAATQMKSVLTLKTSDNDATNRLFKAVNASDIEMFSIHPDGKVVITYRSSGDMLVIQDGAGTMLAKIDSNGKVIANGVNISEGVNARMGTAVLVGGTVTVNTTAVGANSRIMLTAQDAGSAQGEIYISARVAGTSFTILSTNAGDDRSIAWIIFDPA